MDDPHKASSLHRKTLQSARLARPTQYTQERSASAPLAPKPRSPITVSDASTYDEHDQKIVFYARIIAISFVIVGIAVIMGIAIAVSQATTTKMGSTKSSGGLSTTGSNEETLPAGSGGTDPSTGNAGVDSEGAYCSNAYNAALAC